jgi:hypothetical protein
MHAVRLGAADAVAIGFEPTLLERRRAQLRVARRVLDRSVAEPVLDSARVVAGGREAVAAAVAQLVGVNRKGKAGARRCA